ncbi:mRNA export factor-like [Oscarella lobularis]|uniref:mRNA export factor-like n=1 Tax=Oscarella lobularis TaxID=121494 RepID=UPI00331383A4
MAFLGRTAATGAGLFAGGAAASQARRDFVEVTQPPDDSITSVRFSPKANFLVATSWDNNVRCWEIQEQQGQSTPRAQQSHSAPVLCSCWHADGTKVFTGSCDKMAKLWDLNSNQSIAVAQHDAPIKTVNWIQTPSYSCLMTGSWDKTLKFWDARSPQPLTTLQLPERVYCADADYPMAVVGTAGRQIIVYQLENQPAEFKRMESPLKYQHRCISTFRDKKTNSPVGFAVGSIEGRTAIQYIAPSQPKDNFTFKCHRSSDSGSVQDIYAVNDIAFHPVHGTLVTVGSDGKFSYWDKDQRTKLKTGDALPLPLVSCGFNFNGELLAYAASYDWSKGHEHFDPSKKNAILLRKCSEELKPRKKK